DVSDWLDGGQTVDELKRLAAAAPVWAPAAKSSDPQAESGPEQAPPPHGRRTVITIAGTVKPERLRWLWPRRIPFGKETLLAGDADMGKSTISVDVTARVTRGSSWPDGSAALPPAGVVMIGTEDSRSDTVRPRLDAAGADCSRVAFVSVELPDGWE